MTPVLEVFMVGGLLGLLLVAIICSVIIWVRGDPAEQRSCDCADCRTARQWHEREDLWA